MKIQYILPLFAYACAFLVCSQLTASGQGSPWSTAEQELKDKKIYENLLKKPAFYQSTTTRVRYLKQLASAMIIRMKNDLSGAYQLFALTPLQNKGLNNLDSFALYIYSQCGRAPADFNSAFAWATEQIRGIKPAGPTSADNARVSGMYFEFFNQLYTPIIDAIMYTNKKRTYLPRSIDLETLKYWANMPAKLAEPDL